MRLMPRPIPLLPIVSPPLVVPLHGEAPSVAVPSAVPSSDARAASVGASPAMRGWLGWRGKGLALTGLLLTALVLPHSVLAQPARSSAPAKPANASAPKQIGKFEDWTAATHQESGATVCYAFTRAQSSSPTLPGRGDVILTVTQRPTGRDAVAISAGFAYPQGATVTVQVDQTGLDFYTSGRNSFARDGKAAAAAFSRGSRAIARSPGPHDAPVTDTFSLKGFSAAYAATVKACPAK